MRDRRRGRGSTAVGREAQKKAGKDEPSPRAHHEKDLAIFAYIAGITVGKAGFDCHCFHSASVPEPLALAQPNK